MFANGPALGNERDFNRFHYQLLKDQHEYNTLSANHKTPHVT